MTPVSPQGSNPQNSYDPDADRDAALGAAFGSESRGAPPPSAYPPPPGYAAGQGADQWAPPPLTAPGADFAAAASPPVREPPTRNPLILPEPDKDKPRRRRSRVAHSQVLTLLSGLVTLVTLVLTLAWAASNQIRNDYFAPGPLTEIRTVVVPKNAGTADIYDLLVKNGVVRDEPFLMWNAFQIGKTLFSGATVLKAGEWEFQPGMSMADIVRHLDSGRPVVHRITFPEGWSSEQIVARLNADPLLTGKVAAVPDEGTVLPNTYQYALGDTRAKVVDEMRKAQERELKAIWDKRQEGLPLATMRDLVILASIVEKETGKPEERARVAAVFINRLKRNMKLQTDPTIIYGLYKGAAWTEPRTLTKSEMAAANPYNTYVINGLPPGPIANPGRAALEAAANPLKTDELYFVADGTGGHAFAATLAEHNKNVAALRALEAQRNQAAQPPAQTEAPAAVAPPAPPRSAPARPRPAPRPAAPAPANP
jgi:UPF0755 protein